MCRFAALRAKRPRQRPLCGVALAVVPAWLPAMLISASPASAASAPSIESESVSHITSTDATLEAEINPNGLKTTYRFHLESGCLPPMACVAITTYPLPSGEIPASSEQQAVNLDLNSAGVTLKPNTRYAYSLEASNTAGSVQGEEHQFTTLGPPSIESESVSHITSTDATLEAQIYTGGRETDYRVWIGAYPECIEANEWALEECLRKSTSIAGTIAGASSSTTISVDIAQAWQQLSPSTSYIYNVSATNSDWSYEGSAYGENKVFETPSAASSRIESESVSNITPTDATLEAQINTEGLEATYEFHLLERWACEEVTPPCEPPIRLFTLPSGKLLGSFVGQNVSLDLNSAGVTLSPGHDFYEYWVTASGAAGGAEGQPQRFTTPSEAGAEPLSEPGGSTRRQSPTVQVPPALSPAPRSRTLVTYKEEQGGVVLRLTSLVVSADGRATVRFEGCESRFRLKAKLWKRLRATLRHTNLHALAGDHAPATPGAEESTWVITAGQDKVRITASVIPQELRMKLEPLLKVLGEVRSVGQRHMPASCASKRAGRRAG